MTMKKNNPLLKKRNPREQIDWIDIFAHVFNFIWAISILYPMLNVLARSFSSPLAIAGNKVTIFPVNFTLESYEYVLNQNRIITGFINAIWYTALGVVCNVAATAFVAYPLSKNKLIGRPFIMKFMVFSMYFNGGMIPTYLLVAGFGLKDTVWSLIIPTIVYTNNCIIMMNGYRATPTSLYEAAHLDGAGEFHTFIKLALPLSKATIATLALFYFMAHWNDYFTPMLYLDTLSKMPLQVILRSFLIAEQTIESDPNAAKLQPEGIKGAVILISMIPVMIVYPFAQRYFVGGLMIGSVKG